MNAIQIVSIVLNGLLASGMGITLFTLRSVRRKAVADAKQAEASADSTALDNENKANKIMMDYVVEPLKREIVGLRREVTKFRKAVEKIPGCKYAYQCPVSAELNTDEDNEQD